MGADVRRVRLLWPRDVILAGSAFNAGQKSQVFTNAPPGLFFYGDQGIPKAYFNKYSGLFSPRAGVVWDPDGNGKQTIRVSGRHPARYLRTVLQRAAYHQRAVWEPDRHSVACRRLHESLSRLPRRQSVPDGRLPLRRPSTSLRRVCYVNMPLNTKPTYTVQWNLSYQRQLTANWLASVAISAPRRPMSGWVKTSIRLFTCPAEPPRRTPTREDVSTCRTRRPGAAYASIVQSDQGANAHYNGMLFSVQHRMANNFTLLFNYTWSHCISDGDFNGELAGNYYMDPNNRGLRPRTTASWMSAPGEHFADRHESGHGQQLASVLLRGWQLAPIVTVATGCRSTSLRVRIVRSPSIGLDRPNLVFSPMCTGTIRTRGTG